MIAKTALFLAALLLSPFALAQQLWQNTSYGMTVDDVKKVLPNTVVPAKPNKLGTGDGERLRLENVEIVDKTFTAHFYFNKEEKLSQVTLAMAPEPDVTKTLVVFDGLADALRSKYGKEIEKTASGDVYRTSLMTWLSGTTRIMLYTASMDGKDPSLSVIYQGRPVAAASKL